MRIGIVGRHQCLLETAKRIYQQGKHQISIIITCAAPSKEYIAKPEDFKSFANEIGVPFVETEDINKETVIKKILDSHSDFAISMNWIRKIGTKPIEAFNNKIINIHCGDLPRYRGNAVYVWAMLQKEKEIVLTTHYMEPDKLDSGDILLQSKYTLSEDTYIADVFNWMDSQVPFLFVETINRLGNGEIVPQKQSTYPQDALRCYPRNQADGLIDWTQSADDIVRLIQAVSHPLPGAFTYLDLNKIIIWKARVYKDETPYLAIPGQVADRFKTGEVLVCTGRDYVLLEDVQQAGNNDKLLPKDVIKTIRCRLGVDIAYIMDLFTQVNYKMNATPQKNKKSTVNG